MSAELSANARRVQAALQESGFACHVVEMKDTTRSALEAAQAIGCKVEQIAKSLVFRGVQSDMAIVVVTSGANRVNEKKLENVVSESIEKPDADFVREKTGFSIGGVPPLGHRTRIKVFIDQDLLQYDEIWAAAGTPNAVFKLTPRQLQDMTEGQVISVK